MSALIEAKSNNQCRDVRKIAIFVRNNRAFAAEATENQASTKQSHGVFAVFSALRTDSSRLVTFTRWLFKHVRDLQISHINNININIYINTGNINKTFVR